MPHATRAAALLAALALLGSCTLQDHHCEHCEHIAAAARAGARVTPPDASRSPSPSHERPPPDGGETELSPFPDALAPDEPRFDVALDDGLAISYGDVELKLGINAEISLLQVNDVRSMGGNENSVGDFVVNPTFDLTNRFQNGVFKSVDFHFDWVPEQTNLDFADPDEQNFHNANVHRADGYVSRPNFLVQLSGRASVDDTHHFQLMGGSFLTSGLEALESMSVYYLDTPLPLLHGQHYDKGAELRYRYGDFDVPYVDLGLSVIDGDWSIGEPSVFRLHNSAANSYPSFAGHLRVSPCEGVYAGVTGTTGDRGSYPGQKRKQDNVTVYAGLRVGGLETRVYGAHMERNPLGNGNGNHAKEVETVAAGVELAWRELPLPSDDVKLDLYASAWHMRNDTGVPDGEIWFAENQKKSDWMSGLSLGIKWNDPFGVTRNRRSYVSFQYNEFFFDEPESIVDGLGGEAAVFNLALGLRF